MIFYRINTTLHPSDFVAVVGITYLSDTTGQVIPIEELIVHKNYDFDVRVDDVALLKLARPIKFNKKVSMLIYLRNKVETFSDIVISF